MDEAKLWCKYRGYVESIHKIKITEEGKIDGVTSYIFELQQSAQHRVHLTAIAVGGLALIAGIVIGKLWFGV